MYIMLYFKRDFFIKWCTVGIWLQKKMSRMYAALQIYIGNVGRMKGHVPDGLVEKTEMFDSNTYNAAGDEGST